MNNINIPNGGAGGGLKSAGDGNVGTPENGQEPPKRPAPIVITEVTTTRTITINEDADLSDPTVAALGYFVPPRMSNYDAANKHASERNVDYISEDDDDEEKRRRRDQFWQASDLEHGDNSKGRRRHRSSSRGERRRSLSPSLRPASRSKSPPTGNKSKSGGILAPLGSFSEVDATSEVGKMLTAYAENSIYMKPGSRMKVRIHTILKKKDGGRLSRFLSGGGEGSGRGKGGGRGGRRSRSRSKSPTSSGRGRGGSWSSKKGGHGHHEHGRKSSGRGERGDEFTMLLWTKTSPESVRRLASGRDGCFAFYDRFSRALPLPMDKMKENLRQIFILCKVNLGRKYKSPHGYPTWGKVSHPPRGSGCDSVQAVGKYKPNWKKNVQYKSTIVPLGESEKSTRFPTFEVDYNEYFVFKADQIKVKYAIDVEFLVPEKKD
ncbi:Poly [ADP-ribose] polymerase 2-B [Folsomia candida]|uniref:Poly [ADP-ribose] polymerase 2-B n=1 Tax=Folsomia candida TaxID=158441 RepID=A0A226E261_FOLCA|nr:Poly [ADP-ribose] polymerase 2-B [Folsomia candida]